MMLNVGFTGTREGMTEEQATWWKRYLDRIVIQEFHHGKCRGADAQAHQLALSNVSVMRIVIHPPEDPKDEAEIEGQDTAVHELPRKPYLQRNKDIVDATDVLIAMPRSTEEEKRSGTWQTIRYARERGKKVVIIAPNGEMMKSTTTH